MEQLNQLFFSDQLGRRLDERLIKVWNNIRHDRDGVPLKQDFFQQYIGDMWPFLFVIEVGSQVGLAVVERIGEALTSGMDKDYDGKSLVEIPEKSVLYHATRNYDVALLKKGAVSAAGEFVNRKGDIVLYRSTLLPVTKEPRKITTIIGAASYRVQIVI